MHRTQVLMASACGLESRPGRSQHLCPSQLLRPSGGTLSCRSLMHVKEPRTLIVEELGVYPGVSGSHSKRPCLQVSSGFRATVLKCAFEESLVSRNV